MLRPGDSAPDLTLVLDDGTTLNPSRPGERVVLFFFPKAFSPVCTQEACAFRDEAPQFPETRIVGVSRDSVETLRAFREKYRLPYSLGSDADGTIAQAFGATLFGRLPRRATFLIDPDGKIIERYVNDLGAKGHTSTLGVRHEA